MIERFIVQKLANNSIDKMLFIILLCLVFFPSCGEDIISELQEIDSIDNPDITYGPPLPTIKIDTNGEEIVDEPKIPAEFQIFQENINFGYI